MGLVRWVDGIERRDWQTVDAGTVRLALIGVGWWTVDVAIPAIEASDLCETTVLVSGSEEKATGIAAEHGIAHGMTYEAFHDGANTDAYDAVYIATPNAYHLEYADRAAKLGKPVLCEKPLEATAERAEQLVDACSAVPLMTAYRMHTDPLVRRARELISDGAIGSVRYVSGENAQPLLEMNGDPDQWRLDSDLTGYGTSVMDLGIYVINTTRFVLGTDPETAFGHMASVDPAFDDVPDQWASFSLLFTDETPLVGRTSQDATSGSSLTITGSAGRLSLEPAFSGEVVLRLERGDATVAVSHEAISAEREMTEEFDYFADRVLSEMPIGPDGGHGLVDMRTIAAIHESAARGEPVEI